MNRHRAYWSVMGLEPNPHERPEVVRNRKIKETLTQIINSSPQSWGDSFQNVVSILREIHEEQKESGKLV